MPKRENTMDRTVSIARCECKWREGKYYGTASIPATVTNDKFHTDDVISGQGQINSGAARN